MTFAELLEDEKRKFDNSHTRPADLDKHCRNKLFLAWSAANQAAIEALVEGRACVIETHSVESIPFNLLVTVDEHLDGIDRSEYDFEDYRLDTPAGEK